MRNHTGLLRAMTAGFLIMGALLTVGPASAAIFSGGPSDGYAAGATGSSDLSGIVGRSHKFTGGQGDGFSAKTLIFTPPASVDAWQRYGPKRQE